jgi:hypothetical protein
MKQSSQNGMRCAEFEALLTEAVEGSLDTAGMQSFRGHASVCAVCSQLFAEARAGYQWAHTLHEVEPPAHLLHNILAATSGSATANARQIAAPTSIWQRLRGWLGPVVVPLMQPRVAGTFAMAFFSFTLLANLAGFHLASLRHLDLRPSAIRSNMRRSYYETSARVVRYYDSMRFVYEFQTKLRDLKSVSQPQQPSVGQPSAPEKNKKDNKDISNHPDQNREQNYSRQASSGVLEAKFYVTMQPELQASPGAHLLRRTRRLA